MYGYSIIYTLSPKMTEQLINLRKKSFARMALVFSFSFKERAIQVNSWKYCPFACCSLSICPRSISSWGQGGTVNPGRARHVPAKMASLKIQSLNPLQSLLSVYIRVSSVLSQPASKKHPNLGPSADCQVGWNEGWDQRRRATSGWR